MTALPKSLPQGYPDPASRLGQVWETSRRLGPAPIQALADACGYPGPQIGPLVGSLVNGGAMRVEGDLYSVVPRPSRCPSCDVPTEASTVHGAPSLCLPCTEAELGETYEQIRDRVNEGRKVKRKWKV